jgi:uncharacterized Zn-binding protein involved in type VI secretion
MGMPAARKNSTDTVASPDGSGFCCSAASTQSTDLGSGDVYVNGIGVVREDDAMITHNFPGPCCNPHAPVLTTFSSSVYINGKRAGRKGDAYGGDHIISSGSSDVYIGG